MVMYAGHPEDAAGILQQRIQEEKKSDNHGLIPALYVALSDAHREMNRQGPALAAARKALEFGQNEEIIVPVARTFLWANRVDDARAIAKILQSQFEPHRRAYGRLLDGEIAQRERRLVDAVEAFRAAQALSDLWLVRLNLGSSTPKRGGTRKRSPNSISVRSGGARRPPSFWTMCPRSVHGAPPVHWLARAQEGLGMREPALANYKAYLALRQGASSDPLAADASRRLADR